MAADKKKEAPLGSGMAQKARETIKSRKQKLQEAEEVAMGTRPPMSKKWTE